MDHLLLYTYVSGMQKIPKINIPYPIPEKIQNDAGRPMDISIVGENFTARKNDVIAIDVTKPEPISLELEGSNSERNINMHEKNPAPSPNKKQYSP